MNTLEIKKMVSEYQGNNNFMNSLKFNLGKYKRLTDRQLECAERFFEGTGKVGKKKEAKDFSFKQGDKITIRKWLAQNIAKKKEMPFFFRNLVVEEVLDETEKAVQVKVRFNSEIATCCHVCGRGLDNEISKATGIGPVCAKKYLGVKRPTLENASEILEKIEQEAKNAGVVDVGWLPKSQLVTNAQKILFGVE